MKTPPLESASVWRKSDFFWLLWVTSLVCFSRRTQGNKNICHIRLHSPWTYSLFQRLHPGNCMGCLPASRCPFTVPNVTACPPRDRVLINWLSRWSSAGLTTATPCWLGYCQFDPASSVGSRRCSTADFFGLHRSEHITDTLANLH